MSDLIDRQAAIDALTEYGNGRTVYIGVEEAVRRIEQLPSAQSEIVRCKDCKHHSHDAGHGYDWCNRTSGVFRVKPEDFCSRAERRTDGLQ